MSIENSISRAEHVAIKENSRNNRKAVAVGVVAFAFLTLCSASVGATGAPVPEESAPYRPTPTRTANRIASGTPWPTPYRNPALPTARVNGLPPAVQTANAAAATVAVEATRIRQIQAAGTASALETRQAAATSTEKAKITATALARATDWPFEDCVKSDGAGITSPVNGAPAYILQPCEKITQPTRPLQSIETFTPTRTPTPLAEQVMDLEATLLIMKAEQRQDLNPLQSGTVFQYDSALT